MKAKTKQPYWINPKTGKKYSYYDRNGRGTDDVLKWARMFDKKDPKYRIVKQELVCFGLFYVSTVWLGIDYEFNPKARPLIFESMVFCRFPLPRIAKFLQEVKMTYFYHPKDPKWKHLHELGKKFMRPHLFQHCTDLDMRRYANERRARYGHKKLVKEWSKPKHIDGHLWKHLFSTW